MMTRVKPPRAAFVNFPLGHQCGRPNDRALQRGILEAALEILRTAAAPGEIVTLPFEWGEPFDWPYFMTTMQEMLAAEGNALQELKPQK